MLIVSRDTLFNILRGYVQELFPLCSRKWPLISLMFTTQYFTCTCHKNFSVVSYHPSLTYYGSETRRRQERYCSTCSKDQPLHQLGRRHSPKKSRRVLAEENCGSHPDQESHPEHEPGQWPPPTHGLEPHPQPTPLTPHLASFCL